MSKPKQLRFTIRVKLALASLLSIILFFVTGITSYFTLKYVSQQNDQIVLDTIPVAKASANLLTDLVNEETGVRGYLVTGSEEFLEPYKAGHEQLQKDIALIREHAAQHPIMQDLVENQAIPLIQKIESYFQNQIALVQNGKIQEARAKIKDGKNDMDAFRNVFEKIDADIKKLTNDSWNNSKDATSNAVRAILLLSVVTLVLSILSTLYLFRVIVRPITLVSRQLRDIAEGEGDLTRELSISSNDEIGDLATSFNRMVRNLREIIRQVSGSAEQVAASSEQLTASVEETSEATRQITSIVQQVAEGTEQQVRSVQESTTVINELSAGIQQIAVNAQSVSATSVTAHEMSMEGAQAIQAAVKQMDSISQTVNHLGHVIKELGDHSEKIGQIVAVITGIAEQTNLLALNAAIEAARAGEHGRGFAVVAQEVRKLAEQSAESAKQITDLISTVQDETNKAVRSMETATQEVGRGIEIVHTAGESFTKIQESVTQVTEQIQQVSAASQQMSTGTEHAIHSIDTIAEVTENTAAGTQQVTAATEEQLATMEEIGSAARELSKMAEELRSLVGKFKV
ncbi:methyl-accepting chemotaxis protein [Effusibacillus pohliae]|uniref:methyl-accepting chemotaxis protein n=1 Tax=Effusibacillus pohliae TaxID=232270 RepID=UPI00036A5AD6|nr:methyl-accepting chemotaxis protein [Effusibacillus pohliae]